MWMDVDDSEDCWRSADGSVCAEIDSVTGSDQCQVWNMVAGERRKGNGRRAMEELRAQFRFIRIIGCGEPNEPQRLFWDAMAREGLVDELMDIDGHMVW